MTESYILMSQVVSTTSIRIQISSVVRELMQSPMNAAFRFALLASVNRYLQKRMNLEREEVKDTKVEMRPMKLQAVSHLRQEWQRSATISCISWRTSKISSGVNPKKWGQQSGFKE
jgi:hypothetical protein